MERCRKRLEEELSCSICLEYFTDPVTLDCGHNYCHACITKYWGESPTDAACPQCMEKVQVKKLKPNIQLGNVSGITKEMNQLLENSVDRISDSLKFLRKERENIVVYKAENEKESQGLLKQMQAEREKTTAAFRDLRQFLEDQEKLLLAQMDEVEMEIKRRRDEHQTSLSGELSSLDSLIRELEEKLQHSANEPLLTLWNLLERRCPKEPFNNPVAFPVALKWKAHDFSDISPFLKGLMKQFQESLISGLPLQKATVTLDPSTAHPQIILTDNCTTVKLGPRSQDLPNNPERFDWWHLVLGRERFTAGRHFWEVTMGNEQRWSVGVARSSVGRKGKFHFCPCAGFWDLGMWQGTYNVSQHQDYVRLHLNQKLKKIRVTLNCAGGRVAFFDADTGTPLYAYSDAFLPGETFLPFFFIDGGGHLTLCP